MLSMTNQNDRNGFVHALPCKLSTTLKYKLKGRLYIWGRGGEGVLFTMNCTEDYVEFVINSSLIIYKKVRAK